MRGHERTRHARETRERRETRVSSAVGTPVAYVAGAWKETRVHERTRHAMDTREGRETRVTSRIFWLITIVIIIVTNNKTTTSMRRKGLKVIRSFYQYFNHYCHHYHNQLLQGPLLAGTASAWKWYRCMKEQGTRWRQERGERQACPASPLQCHVLSLAHYAGCTITTTSYIIIVNITMKENY